MEVEGNRGWTLTISNGPLERFARTEAAKGILAFLTVICLTRVLLEIANTYIGTGKPFFADYICFWLASQLTLDGNIPLLFDFDAFSSIQQDIFGVSKLGYFYPPVWLLYILPASLLPYSVSAFLFQAGSVVAAGIACAFLARNKTAGWLIFAFPTLVFSIVHGQNGLLNTALLATALACLERRQQVWAGVLIGLMAYKPQFGILIPFALIAGREYRAFLSAALTTISMILFSIVAFGLEPWRLFFGNFAFVRTLLMEGWVNMGKYASVFGWLRQYEVSADVAISVQTGVGLLMLFAVIWTWRQALSMPVKGAVLASAALVATPYALDYDCALLAIPVVLIMRKGLESGFLRYELAAILVAAVAALYSNGWGLKLEHTLIGLPPLILFGLSLRRAVVSTRIRSNPLISEQGQAACAPAE